LDKILGIRIRVHYTWAFVFALVTAIVSTQFPESYPLWQRIALGLVAALFFFAGVTVRELILSFTTIPRESPIKSVTLFAFGGVYQTTRENFVSNHNLLLYFVRFLSNFMIAAIFYGLYAIFINAGNLMIAGLAQWLALFYSMLFLLHFVPAFPLDGGMVLRALLWKSTGDYYRATYIASLTGWSIGLLFIFAGVLAFIVTQQWFVGLVVAAVGWFLYSAAAQTYRLAVLLVALQSTTARDVMTREFPLITWQMSISQLIREQIIVKGWRYSIVADGAKLEGALTIRDIRSVPKRRWHNTSVGDIMTPAIELKTAYAQQSAAALLEQMDYLRIDHMPVLEDDHVIGVVARDSLVRLGKARAEFGV
jgi:Zn-dependent protease/predicted transcriptional regulator